MFFYCLLPVACTSSHNACTEPNPTHPILTLLQMFVSKEHASERDTRARSLDTSVLGRLLMPRSVHSVFIFLRRILYRRAVFTVLSLFNSHGGKSTGATGKMRKQPCKNMLL